MEKDQIVVSRTPLQMSHMKFYLKFIRKDLPTHLLFCVSKSDLKFKVFAIL